MPTAMPISAPDGRLRLVVFDCDGTLVDSQHAILACMRDAFSAHGCAAPEDAAIRRVIGLSLDEAVARLAAEGVPAAEVAEAYRRAFFAMRSRPDFHEPLFPGVAAALDALDSAGCLLGIATGKARRGLLATLERHQLSGRFVTLQTADSNPGKPHPAMLLRAMAEGAVGVAWGYHDRRELEAAGADRIVERCEELADCILSLL
jgi:phosphoglycolate phosphatase